MQLSFERAAAITDARNQAMIDCDLDGFLELWADDCVVEGPQHHVEGKQALRAIMKDAWTAMKPVQMITRSLAVRGDAMFYEFAIVQEIRANGDRILFTGMTYHQVDDSCRLVICREYFDPIGRPRRSAAEEPRLAAWLKVAEDSPGLPTLP